MATKVLTIKIKTETKGFEGVKELSKESVVSGLKVRLSEEGLLSTQSTTLATGTMSAGFYSIIIGNYSTTILNCTTSAGLFVFFSGQTYLSGLLVPDGDFVKFRRHLNHCGEGIHLYSPRGGNAFYFSAYGV